MRAAGEYQTETWTREAREAQDAKAPTAGGAPAQDAAAAMPQVWTPQPIGMGGIALVSLVVIFFVATIAAAVLPRDSKTLAGVIAIAVGLTVWNSLQNKRKQQILRQAGLDAPSAAASKPDDKPST